MSSGGSVKGLGKRTLSMIIKIALIFNFFIVGSTPMHLRQQEYFCM